VVGLEFNVITTSSVLAVHGELLVVQRSVYVDPATPLNVDVALDGVVTVPPVPDCIVQAPDPTVGAFPAKVTCVKPHVADPVWSAPALAVVGVGFTVTVIVKVDPAQFGVVGEFGVTV
jgi:hypothetical protein